MVANAAPLGQTDTKPMHPGRSSVPATRPAPPAVKVTPPVGKASTPSVNGTAVTTPAVSPTAVSPTAVNATPAAVKASPLSAERAGPTRPVAPMQCAPLVSFSFTSGKSVVLDSQAEQVGVFVGWVREHSDARVVVEGHASADGSPAKNLRLSHVRAEAGRRVLIDAGVDAERIVARAFGEYQPSIRDSSREANRRVVVRVADVPSCPKEGE